MRKTKIIFHKKTTGLQSYSVLVMLCLLLPACKVYEKTATLDDLIFSNEIGENPVNVCRIQENYLPDTVIPEATPMRYLRINIHFMNTGLEDYFTEEEAKSYALQLVDEANKKLQHNQKMNLPPGNKTPVFPVNYQYVIEGDTAVEGDEGIYYHYDPELAPFNKKKNVGNQEAWKKYGIRKGEVLNVFLFEHHPDSVRSSHYKVSADGVGYPLWVKMAGVYHHLHDSIQLDDGIIFVRGPAFFAGLLNHEIGHSLGLQHTWNQDDGCDDTPPNPGCWAWSENPPCNGAVSNNVMDYNNCQCAFTPCQLAKIHFNFSTEGKTQRKLLKPVWCTYKPEMSVFIPAFKTVEWNSHRDLEGDIHIGKHATLIIRCEVSLPEHARVIIEPTGTLILDGGKITNKCNAQWEGIVLKVRKKQRPSVILKHGGTIENARLLLK